MEDAPFLRCSLKDKRFMAFYLSRLLVKLRVRRKTKPPWGHDIMPVNCNVYGLPI